MRITFDPAKRAATLAVRQLDFLEAEQVFAGLTHTVEDDRFDYGETRWVTYGLLRGRLVAVVWTPRDLGRHVISMRKCNDKEKRKYQARLA
jgi:uncharacterized DUF497 family protein